jgi:hypothetical protein
MTTASPGSREQMNVTRQSVQASVSRNEHSSQSITIGANTNGSLARPIRGVALG